MFKTPCQRQVDFSCATSRHVLFNPTLGFPGEQDAQLDKHGFVEQTMVAGALKRSSRIDGSSPTMDAIVSTRQANNAIEIASASASNSLSPRAL